MFYIMRGFYFITRVNADTEPLAKKAKKFAYSKAIRPRRFTETGTTSRGKNLLSCCGRHASRSIDTPVFSDCSCFALTLHVSVCPGAC